MVSCLTGAGMLIRPLENMSSETGLRYTDVSVDGAPPWVAIGTAIGALRGLIVDVLWIKVNYMKEKGLYYEVMADSELITRLQPRFGSVWAFLGHNMAYNISVSMHTEQERWDWVRAGIRLVQNEGLRHNPNDLVLHKELAFWYAHKIEGYSDDAHLFYKRMFAQEWHHLLGVPPETYADRVDWIGRIADAPSSMEGLIIQRPSMPALVRRLEDTLSSFREAERFRLDRSFLLNYGLWKAVREESAAARVLGILDQFRAESAFFKAFDEIASDETVREDMEALVTFVRRMVLINEYNMSPVLMHEYTRDLGPIDWRHGQAHALYWARRGAQLGSARSSSVDDIYKILNNDRLQLQAMQDLARYGRITFDPFSTEIPPRFPDPRWIDVIEKQFAVFYVKHYDTRGAGGEGFIEFLKNFMSSAIRQAYRSGEFERAEKLLDQLDARFGRGAIPPNNTFAISLDVFVKQQIEDEYSFQPHLAPSEAVASMRYAFRVGVGQGRERVYRQAIIFVNQVIKIFKDNEYYKYTTQFGTGRMSDLMQDFATLQRESFTQLMTDPSIPMQERATIWAKIDSHAPRLRLESYDAIRGPLKAQFDRHELGQRYELEDLFPAPPGLALYRQQKALEEARLQAEREAQQRDAAELR